MWKILIEKLIILLRFRIRATALSKWKFHIPIREIQQKNFIIHCIYLKYSYNHFQTTYRYKMLAYYQGEYKRIFKSWMRLKY